MRPLAMICGVFIVLCGLIAFASGEFRGLGTWSLAVGFACAGLAGLLSSLHDEDEDIEVG